MSGDRLVIPAEFQKQVKGRARKLLEELTAAFVRGGALKTPEEARVEAWNQAAAPTGDEILAELRRFAETIPPVVQRFWLHDHQQRRALKDALDGSPQTASSVPFGPEVIVDPEENPWPDRIIADYRSYTKMREDRAAGIRAWQGCAQ